MLFPLLTTSKMLTYMELRKWIWGMFQFQVYVFSIFLSIAYDMTDSDNHIRLKVPKRTMSAYACFSRTVYALI